MQIPTHPKYSITEEGIVTETKTGDVIPEYLSRYNLRSVKLIAPHGKPHSQAIARLLLRTYKPLDHLDSEPWISVGYIDGDHNNLVLSNLYWDSTWYEPIVVFEEQKWFPVYSHDHLEIGQFDGFQVRNRLTGAVYKKFVSKSGYELINTEGGWSLFIHHLVALTFLKHPLDTYQLVPNHKDSNKTNNSPINLEWVTYSQNIIHAYQEGGGREYILKGVAIKSIGTGEITIFNSIHDAARFFGTSAGVIYGVICYRVDRSAGYKGYLVKWTDENLSWDDLVAESPTYKKINRFAVKDIASGEIRVYNKTWEIAKAEDVLVYNLSRLFSLKETIPWRGRYFKIFTGDVADIQWPSFPLELAEAYSRMKSGGLPIQVVDEEDNTTYNSGIAEWCNEDLENRCDPAVLSRHLKKGGGQYQWRNWSISYIDAKEYQ